MGRLSLIIFVGSAGLLAYTYALFGLLLWVCRQLARGGPLRAAGGPDGGFTPTVSVIVAAFNEGDVIEARLRNLLDQDYPADRLEIIVASDGSTDRTAELARRFTDRGVRVVEWPENRGKAVVHNETARLATGEILVFGDAETLFDRDFLRRSVAYFESSEYGCGSGNYSFVPTGGIGQTESAYWRMEKALRGLEHDLGILPFASGGCLLVRASLFEPVPSYSDVDNHVPYRVIQQGYRVFYARDAVARDVTVASPGAHYRKRVRTALRSAQGMLDEFGGLWRTRRFTTLWVLISHRILRWMGGFLLAAALVSNVTAALTLDHPVLTGALILQGLFYALGGLGWLAEAHGWKLGRLFRFDTAVYSFVVANIAFVVAMSKLLRNERVTNWVPASH